MYLSSAYLFSRHIRSQTDREIPNTCPGSREEELFLTYLESHCAFGGMYESLSITYLPWTMCALLNIFDFCTVESVCDKASTLLNFIVAHFLLVTTENGSCTFTASARQYKQARLRNWDHNINQLIIFCIGASHDVATASILGDFLATSSWKPSENTLERFSVLGFTRITMSHPTSKIKAVYTPTSLSSIELVPFFW